MIKTIVFDIGNVLTDFRWNAYFREFGYDEDTLHRIGLATVKSPVWNEYDKGLMTEEEILNAFIQNDPELEAVLRQSLHNIRGLVAPVTYAIPWIQDLKSKGYQVLVLSNFSHKAAVECKDALTFLPYTDGGILSYKDHVIKPDPAIYQLLIDRYSLCPEECVFLDDLPQNLLTASQLGMHTILFHNYEQAVEDLKKLGVN